jgi:hypothetical protein
MFPHQLTSAIYRKEQMDAAEQQRLVDFVTCCTQSSWFRSLSRAVRSGVLLLRRARAAQQPCATCGA